MTIGTIDTQGADKIKYLGIWKVDQIIEGNIPIEYQWAVCGKRIALFETDKTHASAFTQSGFAQESYEQFDLEYTDKNTLTGVSRDGSVRLTISFKAGTKNKEIVFSFEALSQGVTCSEHGGWTGTGEGEN